MCKRYETARHNNLCLIKNLRIMKKVVLLMLLLSLNTSFAYNNNSTQVKSNEVDGVTVTSTGDVLSFSFSSLKSLRAFDFNAFLNENELEDGQCTVSVSVSYGGASATFSVTADTCAEAGAGAAAAAAAFVKKIIAMME